MWQLFDIAYVIPSTVFLGYFLGEYVFEHYGVDYKVTSIMVFATLGIILTFFKIKKFVDRANSKIKSKSESNSEV
ncbi:MAG: hypothetical protein HRT47_07305 [Candidatus Caenarcaniphilales bacterium]|nr:hypothetical protein [Candidatus Caenarcaniphilales bacterium]